MGDQPYESMDARQTADALDVYLAEREPALERLRAALTGAGLDTRETLDGSLYSVSPLWAWLTARAARLGLHEVGRVLVEVELQDRVELDGQRRADAGARSLDAGARVVVSDEGLVEDGHEHRTTVVEEPPRVALAEAVAVDESIEANDVVQLGARELTRRQLTCVDEFRAVVGTESFATDKARMAGWADVQRSAPQDFGGRILDHRIRC